MSLLGRLISGTLPYVPKRIAALAARTYIAGETLDEALETAAGLNREGFRTTLDLLGEDTTRPDQARQASSDYQRVLRAVEANGIEGNISVKPTQFGMRIDPGLCLHLFQALVDDARTLGHFVRVEMEDSSCTDPTLELFRKLRADFDNVGIVLQSRLFRSAHDLEGLLDLTPNIRMVKGVYIEPPTLAWQNRQRIRDEYMTLSETLVRHGGYVAFATHDTHLVDRAYELIRRYDLPTSSYEFQLLLGVRRTLGESIRDRGHPIRVYVPFGSDWHPYSMRRLRENPQVAGYIVKAMLGRG